MGERIAVAVFLVIVVAACAPQSIQQIAEDGAKGRNDGGVLVVVTEADGKRTVGVAGSDATGQRITPDVTWRIGSITKTFTAVVVMQLVEEGLADLDADVSEYLANPVVPDGVTVRHLLQHTSGIPDYIGQYNVLARSCPDRAISPLPLITEDEPEFAPGESWEYSNTNYVILGQLIQAITGDTPASVIRERIIDPLDLEDTYLEGSEAGPPPVPSVADFYETGPGPITCEPPIPANATDGGMVSGVSDLDRFLRAIFTNQLVSPQSLDEMLDTNQFGYGLGLIRLLEPPVENVEIYGHGGGVVGYQSIAQYETSTGTTIISMNLTGHGITDQQTQAIKLAFQQ